MGRYLGVARYRDEEGLWAISIDLGPPNHCHEGAQVERAAAEERGEELGAELVLAGGREAVVAHADQRHEGRALAEDVPGGGRRVHEAGGEELVRLERAEGSLRARVGAMDDGPRDQAAALHEGRRAWNVVRERGADLRFADEERRRARGPEARRGAAVRHESVAEGLLGDGVARGGEGPEDVDEDGDTASAPGPFDQSVPLHAHARRMFTRHSLRVAVIRTSMLA